VLALALALAQCHLWNVHMARAKKECNTRQSRARLKQCRKDLGIIICCHLSVSQGLDNNLLSMGLEMR